jgi:hypothetical protein
VAEVSVPSGDPSQEGLYAMRVKVPARYKVPAHTHPNDEMVTVVSGTFNFGMGPTLTLAVTATTKGENGATSLHRPCAERDGEALLNLPKTENSGVPEPRRPKSEGKSGPLASHCTCEVTNRSVEKHPLQHRTYLFRCFGPASSEYGVYAVVDEFKKLAFEPKCLGKHTLLRQRGSSLGEERSSGHCNGALRSTHQSQSTG